MKKKLSLLLVASILSISSFSVVQAANLNSFQPYYNKEGNLVMPSGGFNAELLEKPVSSENLISPRMTSTNIFSIYYSIGARGSLNSRGSSGKYLSASDISNDVLEINSIPSSSNSSGSMDIGLGYYNSWEDEVLAPSNLLVNFSTTSRATKNIYSPKLTQDTYYGVVNNKSGNRISGDVYYNDLQ